MGELSRAGWAVVKVCDGDLAAVLSGPLPASLRQTSPTAEIAAISNLLHHINQQVHIYTYSGCLTAFAPQASGRQKDQRGPGQAG